MRPFRLLLEHPAYWSLNRRSITRAVALGLFVSFVPLPVHIILGAVLALLFRVNVPAAVTVTFITNPLTMVPMFLAAYWVGGRLLGVSVHDIHFEMSWHWLSTSFVPIWKPFLLGCLVMGTTAAVLGYITLGGIWHLSLVLKYHKRKGANGIKASQDAGK